MTSSSDKDSDSEQDGLYNKYDVYKNGETVPNSFVLEPESDPVARLAIRIYAAATEDEELAKDLVNWMDELADEARIRYQKAKEEGEIDVNVEEIIDEINEGGKQ